MEAHSSRTGANSQKWLKRDDARCPLFRARLPSIYTDYTKPRQGAQWARCDMSQQSSNVLFGQSRNVLLTGPSLEGGQRTATDDPSRTRPAGGLEKGQEEIDHTE